MVQTKALIAYGLLYRRFTNFQGLMMKLQGVLEITRFVSNRNANAKVNVKVKGIATSRGKLWIGCGWLW